MSYEVSAITLACEDEEVLEPMFLVCRGVQKGRPIPIQCGTYTVGRGPLCDVSIQGRGISRTHMRLDASHASGVVITDAASTNGVFVNGRQIDECALNDRDVVQIGPETVLRFTFAPACEMDLRVRQYDHSIVDDLTGVHNRRYLNDSLEHEIAFAARHEQHLCVMMLDVDYFKSVNDELGHEAGDTVLKQLAERLADALRNEDTFARLGGDEFVIIARGLDTTSSAEAAERLRTLVSDRPFRWHENEIECTISIGGTMLVDGEAPDVGSVLKRADENLYCAKQDGRNGVFIR